MIKIDAVGDRRRYPRHAVKKRVRVFAEELETEGETADISGGGVSLDLVAPLHNDLFVDLHIQGLGRISGRVVRVRELNVAVKFYVDEEEEERIARRLEKIDMSL